MKAPTWEQIKPQPKVAAGSVSWSVAVVLLMILEAVEPDAFTGTQELILTGAIAGIAAWLMPNVPPWRK